MRSLSSAQIEFRTDSTPIHTSSDLMHEQFRSLQVDQVSHCIYGYQDIRSGGKMCTNSVRTVIEEWLNASQSCQVGGAMNKYVRETSKPASHGLDIVLDKNLHFHFMLKDKFNFFSKIHERSRKHNETCIATTS